VLEVALDIKTLSADHALDKERIDNVKRLLPVGVDYATEFDSFGGHHIEFVQVKLLVILVEVNTNEHGV